ncbi:MAG: hypothetical protein IPM35_34465 [Myxococcales bacterium]|nr:hypothetical protein [Myxococcales bacterium]
MVLVLLLISAAAYLMWRGFEFYRLDLESRLDHPDRELLAPGKPIGHGYGVVGTVLMLTNLFYIVRRKLARLPLGSMRAWLNLHVTTGLVGGVLVVFHSAFQLRSPIATTTMVALFAVLLTGIFGRYLYALTPEPDHARFEKHMRVFDSVGPGMGKVIKARLAAVPPSKPKRPSLLAMLLLIPAWIREAQQRRQIVLETAAEYELAHLTEVRLLGAKVAESAEIAAAEVRAAAADALLRSWRSVHRFAALLLVVLVIVHIAVAWYLGYRWIFSTE